MEDDSTSQMGVVITCGDDVTMNIYEDQECTGDAAYSVSLVSADTCIASDDSSYSTYITCQTMDFSSYSYDVQKIWASVGSDAVNQCDSSTDASDLDSEMFEAYPTDNCVPESVTQSKFSFMATSTDNDDPALMVYENDECDGAGSLFVLDPTCESGEIVDNIYGAKKYQYNKGNSDRR
jgi:hypothetical protein